MENIEKMATNSAGKNDQNLLKLTLESIEKKSTQSLYQIRITSMQ